MCESGCERQIESLIWPEETKLDRTLAIEDDPRLRDLLDTARPGERLAVTRGGKVVATIVPTANERDQREAAAAMQRIFDIGDGVSLGGLRFKDLIEEGRR